MNTQQFIDYLTNALEEMELMYKEASPDTVKDFNEICKNTTPDAAIDALFDKNDISLMVVCLPWLTLDALKEGLVLINEDI